MDLELNDQVVLVTGASGGIGRATASALADEGARLALHAGRNLAELEAWVEEQPWRERALCVQADLGDAQALERCLEQARDRWGRVDGCVANAGVWPPEDARLDELPLERLERTIDINLVGALRTARAFFQTLREQGPRPDGRGAALVFTGSTAGRFGERGHVDYAVSKAGLVGALLTLKNEIVQLDPYARVNLVEPGWTVTHMARPALDEPGTIERVTQTMALRQLARARDIAATLVWLLSPSAARHITGQVVTVAGGMEGRTLWDPAMIDAEAVRERLRE